MSSASTTKFDAALNALEHAMRSDLAFEEVLTWDARFKQFYTEHVQEVIESSPAFAPLGTNLETRLNTLVSWAKQERLTISEVKSIMGVEPHVFKAFLSRLRITHNEALLYLGGGHIVQFDFSNLSKEGLH